MIQETAYTALKVVVWTIWVTVALVVLGAFALGCTAEREAYAVSALDGIVDVRDYGALCDGVADDRPAFQAAMDAAGERDIAVPLGMCRVTGAPGRYWALYARAGNTLRGTTRLGSVLVLADGTGPSVRLIQIAEPNVTIDRLTLLGGIQSVDEHRAAIFMMSTGARISRTNADGFSGDGYYLYQGAIDTTFIDVEASGNNRNGLTLGATVDRTLIRSSHIFGNRVQQIDHEPGGTTTVSNTTIVDSVITGSPGNYAITLSGSSGATQSHDLTLVGNTITGGVEVLWASGVMIVGNTITSVDTPPVTLYRTTADVTIERNTLAYTGATNFASTVAIIGTTGQAAARTRIVNNRITNAAPVGIGIRGDGPTSVTIDGNMITGGYTSVAIRTTVPGRDVERATVVDNTISSSHDGVSITGNATAVFRLLELTRNNFSTMTHATVLNGAPGGELAAVFGRDNVIGLGVAPIVVPATCTVLGSAL